MVKRELTSPHKSPSTIPSKRSRMDRLNGQPPTVTSPVPNEDSEGIQDMWNEPLVVSKSTWAVKRCLNDHGDKSTLWSPGHFVAVAMWSGGLEAGVQAAKALRIFGIWSPHADDKDDGLPALGKSTVRDYILDKIWPTCQVQQGSLLNRANRFKSGTPFPDFETAHHHLLRECIGPDLTRFPAVVRPKLKFGYHTPRPWKSLITEEQSWNTLVPVLRKHFDSRVEVASVSQSIQPYALEPPPMITYGGSIDSGENTKAKSGGRYGLPGGNISEINLVQIDDNEDDEEDFEQEHKDAPQFKADPGTSKEDTLEPVRKGLDVSRQDSSDTKYFVTTPSAHRYRRILPRPTTATETGKPSPTYGPANDAVVQARPATLSTRDEPQSARYQAVNAARTTSSSSAVFLPLGAGGTHRSTFAKTPIRGPVNGVTMKAETPNLPTHEEPQSVRHQVVNQLYERTCGVSLRKITRFLESRNRRSALPNIWRQVCEYRTLNNMLQLGSKDQLPHPRRFSNASLKAQ
jgi:hypothetical protein